MLCSSLGAFFTCGYQYVAKLNSGLNQVLYATYVSGEYGATPAAISVDAQGDAFVAGTTNSPDYPTTPNAYEPQYIASATPSVSCFFIINCVNLPPASGYLTEVNPTGTGLIYSSYFSGTADGYHQLCRLHAQCNLSRRKRGIGQSSGVCRLPPAVPSANCTRRA